MDELLIIRSLGVVSNARSPQLKSAGVVMEKAGRAIIIYQINYK
jgi:hypothetical protein